MQNISNTTNFKSYPSATSLPNPTATSYRKGWSHLCFENPKDSEIFPFKDIYDCFNSIFNFVETSKPDENLEFSANILMSKQIKSASSTIPVQPQIIELSDILKRCERELELANNENDTFYCDPWIREFAQSSRFEEMTSILKKNIKVVSFKTRHLKGQKNDHAKILNATAKLISSFNSEFSFWAQSNPLIPQTLNTSECIQLTLILIIKTRLVELISNQFVNELENTPSLMGIDSYCITTLKAAVSLIKNSDYHLIR